MAFPVLPESVLLYDLMGRNIQLPPEGERAASAFGLADGGGVLSRHSVWHDANAS